MKNRLLLTILIILILPLSAVCQDVRPHPEGFIITREFAELTASRFDSLNFYKTHTGKLNAAIDTCAMLLNYAESVVTQSKKHSDLLEAQIITQSEIIKSHSRTDDINKNLQRSLKVETRKRKAWKVTAITALGLFGTSLLYISIR